MYGSICPQCAAEVDFQLTACPVCGQHVGFPNVRFAENMRADLDRHYAAAIADADRRGVLPRVAQLEQILKTTVATIMRR